MKNIAAALVAITAIIYAIGLLSDRRPAPKPTKWVAIVRSEGGNKQLVVDSSGWVVTQSGMDTCVVFTNESENVAMVCGVLAVGKAE